MSKADTIELKTMRDDRILLDEGINIRNKFLSQYKGLEGVYKDIFKKYSSFNIDFDQNTKVINIFDEFLIGLMRLVYDDSDKLNTYVECIEKFQRDINKLNNQINKPYNIKSDPFEDLNNSISEFIVQSSRPLVDKIFKNIEEHNAKLGNELENANSHLKKVENGQATKDLGLKADLRLTEKYIFLNTLKKKTEEFYQIPEKAKREPNALNNFMDEISQDITTNEKKLAIPRNAWRPIMATIATALVSLTGVGLIYTAPKIHAAFKEKSTRPLLFGQSTSLTLAKDVKKNLEITFPTPTN